MSLVTDDPIFIHESVLYTNQITNELEDSSTCTSKTAIYKTSFCYIKISPTVCKRRTNPHKTADSHFPTYRLSVCYSSVAAYSNLLRPKRLLSVQEKWKTTFHAQHHVPPVTCLPTATFHLPLTRGFCTFAQLPPSRHHIWFHETFPSWHCSPFALHTSCFKLRLDFCFISKSFRRSTLRPYREY